MSEDDRGDELLRQFEAVISGGGLDELRGRPELRRPRLGELKLFRVRVDLRQSTPPIWRRLELRSDLTLDVVHKVLQAVFDWQDYHLWRFSLGGEPFDPNSQLLLCQWDLDEGDEEGGVGAAEVCLDEVLQEPGDLVSYVYDYGDHWELTLVLEDVSPAPPAPVSAIVLDGRRAAPPEDCGGLRDAESLAEVLPNPARFDLDEINAALRKPFFALTEAGIDPRLVNLIDRLAHSPFGDKIITRALRLLDPGERPDPAEEIRGSFAAFTWFLDRAAEGPIPLTASGYLKPVDVQALAPLVPMMGEWIGKANREADTYPVLHFRELICRLGLLRKYKGTLRLTKAGAKVHGNPEELWDFIAERLSPADDGFDEPANLLALFFAATSRGDELPIDEVAGALNYLGWRVNGTKEIEPFDLYWMAVLGVLRNVAERPVVWQDRWRISPAAARLARATLQTG